MSESDQPTPAGLDDTRSAVPPSIGPVDNTAELGSLPDGDALGRLPVEVPGSRIGPYRLVRQIGEGGFGSVFLAEQEEPVRRSVAIKVVKLGMDTRQVVARFEQERQTLALMEHPNIARVLDAGATDSGRPYFVMELVKGEPIVAYCDRNGLSVRERIELVVDVCRAVQHAHTKGILHRDLKPSNILVAVQDGRPTAKVIDFGIAKATGTGGAHGCALTEQRQLIGTPEYMSPEQAEGSLDIDTRTDIYSLGVLLYELLTGTTPFSAAELRSAAIGEIQRIIREVDPPRPSTRLSRSGETIVDIASRRRSEPATLGATIRGELDWIVMKALEKDRLRRYASANDLAEDIRRYLGGEAVLAAPPSRAYRFRKLARRHRLAFGATAALTLSILVGAAAFAWQAQVARSQRDRALFAEAEQRDRATELDAVAEFQAAMLSRIDVAAAGDRLMNGLRTSFAETLAAEGLSDKDRSDRLRSFESDMRSLNGTDAASELIRSTLLTPAVEAVEAQFASQPLVEAALRETLARVHLALGWTEEALPLADRALEIRRSRLGERHRDTLTSLETVASVTEALGRTAEAVDLYRAVFETRRDAFGTDDVETLIAMGNLGNAYRSQGQFDLAEPLLTDALAGQRRALGNEARSTLIAMNTLGFLHVMRGDMAKTEALWREAYETGRRVFGEDDKDVIVWTYNLAGLLQGLGKLREAETHFRSVLDRYRRLNGSAHPTTITVLAGLGNNLQLQSRFAESEIVTREALEQSVAAFGPEHPTTLRAMNSLGSLLTRMDRAADAEPLLREALSIWQRTAGEERAETLSARESLARALLGTGAFEACTALYAETLANARRILGNEHPQTLTLMTNAANALLAMRRPAEAEPLLTEALASRRRVSGEEHVETTLVRSNLALLREQQDRLEESEELQRDAIERFRRTVGPDHIHTINATVHCAHAMRRRGLATEAAAMLAEIRPALEAKVAPDSLSMATFRLRLGQALLDLGRYPEARAELEIATKRILAAPATSPASRQECERVMATLVERESASASPAGGP